jgi:hypothetical protein
MKVNECMFLGRSSRLNNGVWHSGKLGAGLELSFLSSQSLLRLSHQYPLSLEGTSLKPGTTGSHLSTPYYVSASLCRLLPQCLFSSYFCADIFYAAANPDRRIFLQCPCSPKPNPCPAGWHRMSFRWGPQPRIVNCTPFYTPLAFYSESFVSVFLSIKITDWKLAACAALRFRGVTLCRGMTKNAFRRLYCVLLSLM